MKGAEDLNAFVADGFTLAAVGDCISSRRLAPLLERDAGFAAAVGLLRGATAAFGNLETTLLDLRGFAGAQRTMDDWALVAPPEVAADLASLGFDFVSRANNHVMDWGAEGLRTTSAALDDAGLVHAGAGATLAAARAPRYLETRAGRVGLVSLHTTPRLDQAAALDQFGEVPPRPGFNALRYRTTITVLPETLERLREISRLMDPAGMGMDMAHRKDSDVLTMFETRFVAGDTVAVAYEPDAEDLEENLRSIRLGKQHADLMVVSAHVHEEGPDPESPPPFLVDVAHAAVDAGADVFAGHGVHRLWPVELYRGRPIFYGLGNFLFSDIQEPVTKILYEEARDLLVEVFEDPSLATDADVNRLLNAHGFDDQRYFESVVVEVEYAGGHTVSIRLHPIELGKGRRLTESGIPRRAEHEAATSILKRLVRASEPFGTSIDITDGTGVITP